MCITLTQWHAFIETLYVTRGDFLKFVLLIVLCAVFSYVLLNFSNETAKISYFKGAKCAHDASTYTGTCNV